MGELGPEIGIRDPFEVGAALGSALGEILIAYPDTDDARKTGMAVVSGALSSGARVVEAPNIPMSPALVLASRRKLHAFYVHGRVGELWYMGLPEEVAPGPVRRAEWREIPEPLRVDPRVDYLRILGRREMEEVSVYSPAPSTAILASEVLGGTALWGRRPEPGETPGRVFVELDASGTRILSARIGGTVLGPREAIATTLSEVGGGVLECTFPPVEGAEYECGYRDLVERLVRGAPMAGWSDGRVAVREFWSWPDAIAATLILARAERPHPGWEEEEIPYSEEEADGLKASASRISAFPGVMRLEVGDSTYVIVGGRIIRYRMKV